MKFLALKLFVISVLMFAATSAFASLSYQVSVDTSSLKGQDGYLYFQYLPVNAVASSVSVLNFATDGVLAGAPSTQVVDGSAVTGQLPGTVNFGNLQGVNDYNHAVHFGTGINFNLLFAGNSFDASNPGSSTFSLGLFSDEAGLNPLLGGTVLAVDLNNDGTTAVSMRANEAAASPTPIPAAAWLFGSGLMGLVGLGRRKRL